MGVFILSGVTSLLMLALPVYMTQVFMHVLPSRSVETLIALSAMAALAFFLLSVFDGVRQTMLARLGARYEALLSGPVVFAHFLDQTRDAASGAELMQDIRQIRTFLGSRALAAITEAPFMVIFLVLLFIIDPAIGWLTMAGMALMVVTTIVQQSALNDRIKAQSDATRNANRILQAHIDQAETVRIMGLQKNTMERWGEPAARALSTYISSETAGAFYGGISRFLRFGLQAAVLGYGAYLAIQGLVAPIVVFAAMMISGRALAPLDGLVGSWSALMNAWNAHKRVRDNLTGFYVQPDRHELPAPEGRIQVTNLIYGPRAGQEPVIKRISFEVLPGETLAIIGPSGAGKSTLLRLIAGGLRPSSGSIRLDRAELSNWNPIQLGRHVGYVPQSVDFLPGTVAQNIARFNPDADDKDVVAAAIESGVHNMILGFPQGYDTQLSKDGFMPSGGQKQLLALARAFYKQPNLLFLDEPNANLDADGDVTLVKALQKARERKATVVIVTQRPNLLQICDKVLVLKGGFIENFGPASDIRPKVVPQSPERAITAKKPAEAIAAPEKNGTAKEIAG